MKLLVALSIAIAIAAPSRVAGLDLCDYAELPTQLGDLVEPAFKCQTASGYSFVTPSTLPTKAELSKICAKCTDLITAALAKDTKLPACQLVLDSGSAVTVDNFFQGIASQCASNATTSTSSSSSSAATSASAGVVSVIPIVTTPPSSSPPATDAPSAGSASTSSTTKSPGKGPADQPNDSMGSDDEKSASQPEVRTETDDSTSDDGFMPGTAHSSPATDTDSTDDQPSSGGSPSKTKTTSPTAAMTKTSFAMTTTGVTSVVAALVASSLAAWSL